MVALLTCVRAPYVPPRLMRAFMPLPEIVCGALDVLLLVGRVEWVITPYNLSRSCEEAVFVPLRTRTILPTLTADVAEFSAAYAAALAIS